MLNLNFRKWSRCVQQLPKWGAAVTCLFMVCTLKDFKVLRFCSHFAAAKWVYRASKWHSCAKKWFRSFEILFKMELWLRNWDFSRFGISQPFRSCEMRVTVLQNGTRVPKALSQPRNTLRNGALAAKKNEFIYFLFIYFFLGFAAIFAAAKWGSLCCAMALVSQNRLRHC